MASSSASEIATTNPDIEFFCLPKDESSIQPYKQFRLKSLLLTPEAFSSTHSDEAAFPDSIWEARLLSPLANIFVAWPALRSPSDYHDSHDGPMGQISDQGVGDQQPQRIDSCGNCRKRMIRCRGGKAGDSSCDPCKTTGDDSCQYLRAPLPSHFYIPRPFMGSLVLLGPLPIPPSALQTSTGLWTDTKPMDQLLKDAVRPLHFRFNAMFNMPEARGKGLGKGLVAIAVDFARSFAQQNKVEGDEGESEDFVISLAVELDNFEARRLYEKCGFVRFGDFDMEGRPGDDGQRKILLLEYRENC